jgi:hypothetical protein
LDLVEVPNSFVSLLNDNVVELGQMPLKDNQTGMDQGDDSNGEECEEI